MEHPNVVEVTAENFDREVLETSHRVPVLVDFWAEWCGPCKMQLPILLQLAERYAGKFVLGKVNTDEQQALASHHGIRSIPTMKLFRHGQVVDEVMGVQSEASLRQLLDPYIERASDRDRARAAELAQQGDLAGAIAVLERAMAADPDNRAIPGELAELALRAGDAETAERILAAIPADRREDAPVARLAAWLTLARMAGPDSAPVLRERLATKGDLASRVQLAARLALDGDHEDALEEFLAVLHRDRAFDDEAGRRGMLAVFRLLDDRGPLVTDYRKRLFNALH